MLTSQDLQENICQELYNLKVDGFANTLYWYAGDPKQYRKYLKGSSPDGYAVITTPLRNVPRYLNHPEEFIRMIATYRLKHKR